LFFFFFTFFNISETNFQIIFINFMINLSEIKYSMHLFVYLSKVTLTPVDSLKGLDSGNKIIKP